MSQVHPVVRYLIVCEDVHVDTSNPRRVSLIGLISTIRALDSPPYPFLYEELCVFVQLTECRGPAQAWIECRHADSGHIAFRTPARTVQFSNDPLEVCAVAFRIRDCSFPSRGLYWVAFCYNGTAIAEQPLLLR